MNLAVFVEALNAGSMPLQILKMHTFVHVEPQGIFAIAQGKKGSRGNLAETRLYVYPDTDQQTLHLLTIGTKDTQPDDIQFYKGCVDQLEQKKRETETHEHPERNERPDPISES